MDMDFYVEFAEIIKLYCLNFSLNFIRSFVSSDTVFFDSFEMFYFCQRLRKAKTEWICKNEMALDKRELQNKHTKAKTDC